MRYEIIPLPSANDCIRSLPPASLVSVTCSPSRGIPATQQLCESLLSLGHTPVPHLAARCVAGPSHAAELAAWVRACGLKEVFIVGGDAPRAAHEMYTHALPFMSDFLSAKVHRLAPLYDILWFSSAHSVPPLLSPPCRSRRSISSLSLHILAPTPMLHLPCWPTPSSVSNRFCLHTASAAVQ